MIHRLCVLFRNRLTLTCVLISAIANLSSCYLTNSNITSSTGLNNYHLNKTVVNGTESAAFTDDNNTQTTPETNKIANEYSSDDIIILEGLNAVRKRPGMYIGNTGVYGIHQLLYEILDNSVDEYLAGHCNKIAVTLFEDGSAEVSDNGRGIPCDISANTKKSGLETVLTILHSGGKFQDNPGSTAPGTPANKSAQSKRDKDNKLVYNYSSGLHGVGLSVVNALSEYLIVDVFKGKKQYHIELSEGKIVKPLKESQIETADGQNRFGTTIKFLPDYQHIFKNHHEHTPASGRDDAQPCTGCKFSFSLDMIKNRVKELSYLNPGLFIKLTDHRVKTSEGAYEETFHTTGGTRAFLEELIRDKTPLYKPVNIITIRGNHSNVNIEASFSWSHESYTPVIKAYANNVSTVAGTHIDGFKTAITRVRRTNGTQSVNGLLKKCGYFKGNVKPLNGEFIREGLSAIISVKLNNAEFDGQTKTKLGNTAVKAIMEKVIYEQLTEVLEHNRELLVSIHNKSQAAKKAYDAAKTAKELIRQKASNLISNISGKLTECTTHNIDRNELFIVEGESAAGNAKQARDRAFQAVLPLKGKILNIEKIADNNKVLENQQIQLLINAIGLNVNPITWRQKEPLPGPAAGQAAAPWDAANKLRYGKIILLTDADVDGSHLKSLLLCLLYRLCPSLYLEGRVYVATPPLYRITNLRNKKYIYSWSKEELDDVVAGINGRHRARKRRARRGAVVETDLRAELTRDDRAETEASPAGPNDTIKNKNYVIQRFKGLGEMMAKQLWETTMDPQKRILKRIVVGHPHEISDTIRLLMGSDVQSRKQYIFGNSHSFQLQDLDI